MSETPHDYAAQALELRDTIAGIGHDVAAMAEYLMLHTEMARHDPQLLAALRANRTDIALQGSQRRHEAIYSAFERFKQLLKQDEESNSGTSAAKQ